MEITKIPRMEKKEYDRLIHEGYVCRIAFSGGPFPYIAPFLYVFDGRYMYFLPTTYGRKIEYFRKDPSVSVEIEDYSRDLSCFTFMSLQGYLEEITDPQEKKRIRNSFVDLIKSKGLSPKVLSALGYSPRDSPEIIAAQDRNLVWRLVGVKDIVALKNE